jgi:hypothetical protein
MSNLTTDNPVALQALRMKLFFSMGMTSGRTGSCSHSKGYGICRCWNPSVDHLAKPAITDKSNEVSALGSEKDQKGIVNALEVLGGEFIYQGSKDQGILFILRYVEYPYFSQRSDAFEKTIGALKLTKENVAVVNLANAHNPNDLNVSCSSLSLQRLFY